MQEKYCLPAHRPAFIHRDPLCEFQFGDEVIEGVIRFFAGYAGWDHGQLAKEIKENSWLIGKAGKETLPNQHFRDLWHTSLNEMGGKYAIWARYPQYPSLN